MIHLKLIPTIRSKNKPFNCLIQARNDIMFPMNSQNHKTNLGKIGESIAEKYLKSEKYRIIAKNYFLKTQTGRKLGEIDIIAKKENVYIFVEVKSVKVRRAGDRPEFAPELKINTAKTRKIIITAKNWLRVHKIALTVPWQIDIIAIEIDNSNEAHIRHYENAVEDIKY